MSDGASTLLFTLPSPLIFQPWAAPLMAQGSQKGGGTSDGRNDGSGNVEEGGGGLRRDFSA